MAKARRSPAKRREKPRRAKTVPAKTVRPKTVRPKTVRGEAAYGQWGGETPPHKPPGSRGARTPLARATRDHHPASRTTRAASSPAAVGRVEIPKVRGDVEVELGGRRVRLTNLDKVFFAEIGASKRDLLQYYADVAEALLPHIRDRAMVMKRYPNGSEADFFFMKRVPAGHPAWIELCSIEHESGNVIDFPIIQDLPALLWVINLGCIDLNQWYARCDDTDRPDYLHFDLDPVPKAGFERVCEAALLLRDALTGLRMKCYAKTTGSKGIHVYVPIVRGPTQKQVWEVAREFAQSLAKLAPKLLTAEYRVAKRPAGRVLVDYNQNAWGRTLASVYSVRPRPRAPVSTPVTWKEIERGIRIEDFRLDNVRERIREQGDLWSPLVAQRGRFRLESLF